VEAFMKNAETGSCELRMLGNAKNHIRESGQFRTAENLAELFRLDINDLQSRLQGWKIEREFLVDDGTGERFPIFAFDGRSGLRLNKAVTKVLDIFECWSDSVRTAVGRVRDV
jgi:hypothetical protein